MSTHISTHKEWAIHQFPDGHLEAWRTVSPVYHLRSKVKGGHDIKRLVLLAKTLADAEAEIDLRQPPSQGTRTTTPIRTRGR